MQGDARNLNALGCECIQHFWGKVQASRGRGNRSRLM